MVPTNHLMWSVMLVIMVVRSVVWVIMVVGSVMARVHRWTGIVVVQMSRFQIAEPMGKCHPEQ